MLQRMMSNCVERSNDFITTLIDIIRHRFVLHDYVAYKEIKQHGVLIVMMYDVAAYVVLCRGGALFAVCVAPPPPRTILLFCSQVRDMTIVSM